MGIETRIGIVTGLVIVVIASVYFFYGNNSDKDQFVVATGSKAGDKTKASEPPKIPANADRGKQAKASPAAKPPTVANKTPVGAPARPAPGPALPQVASGQPSRPGAPSDRPAVGGGSPAAADARSPGSALQGPPAPVEPRHQEGLTPKLAKLDEPKGDAGLGSAGSGRTPSASPPDAPAVTPLRTGPSQGLVDATKENIEKAQNPPTTTGPDSSSTHPKATEPPRRTPIVLADPSKPDKPSAAAPLQPSTPAAGGASGPRQHKVANGDTLADISQKYFGDARHVSEILAANPQIKDPRRLRIGDQLVIPAANGSSAVGGATQVKLVADASSAGGAAKTPEAKPGDLPKPPSAAAKTYQVKEGDTFYGIAKALYGDGTRWHEIYELNKTALKHDPKRLKAGMVLNLPE